MQRTQASRLLPPAITVNVWSELEDYWQVRTIGSLVCNRHSMFLASEQFVGDHDPQGNDCFESGRVNDTSEHLQTSLSEEECLECLNGKTVTSATTPVTLALTSAPCLAGTLTLSRGTALQPSTTLA
jgi:hypothetical protein